MKKIIRIILLILGAFILIGVSVAFLRPSTIISKKEAKERFTLPESHFLQWRGGEIHYVDEGSGVPILMIHGLAGSHRNFGKIAARLKSNYRVIRIDIPGFGLSDLPPRGDTEYRELYLDFFEFFLDTMKLDSFYVMGNSLGGWMAWEIAAHFPERVKKLTLLCSAGYDMESVAARLGGLSVNSGLLEAIAAKGIPRFFTNRIVNNCFADVTKVSEEEVTIANALTNRETNFHTIMELLRHRKDADTTLLQKIQCPTLLIWGDKDKIVPAGHAQRFHRDIPNNKLIIYDNCGHVPMIECTERLEKDFRAFAADTSSYDPRPTSFK